MTLQSYPKVNPRDRVYRLGKLRLRFVHTRDVDLVRDAISMETLPSFQIAMAGDSNNM